MYKKSITRIEKENESNQPELSNPALHDIIATNHVMLAKKPHEERLSRACKAVILMIILGFLAIGIIVLTVILAHSRNALMAIVSRSAEANLLETSNNTRFIFANHENLTTVANEQTAKENWSKTTTVSLTSDNLPTLTTQNVHISSLIMRTTQRNEPISLNTQSTKSYPSSNTIVNEQSTIPTTVSNQQTTYPPSSHASTTTRMAIVNELMTTMTSQDYAMTSSDNPTTSSVDSTETLIDDSTMSMPEETSFTMFISRHFHIQSSTVTMNDEKPINKLARKLKINAEEDAIDDLLFSS